MKTKLLLYCTKGKPYLFNRIIRGKSDGYYTDIVPYDIEDEYLCGKIVAECECEVEAFEWWSNSTYDDGYFNNYGKNITEELCNKSCLTYEQLFNYIGGVNNGYALHLSNIKVFEKPLELSEVYYRRKLIVGNAFGAITEAPQNMMWVWYNGQKYCLISIRPEWLCKELNGEKPIEVRRKILKGMM